ncbi:Mitochondrial inner membrane translocase subunit Tim17/Tim22/Tim23/peroxisomal protein PMP24 [Ostreococcus tauri]|uniref:Mitochondrial inner membrane translocase subunit Tim17/Tim22/Tim23/peroxisomal protein PMP24 n=1 Tax=Ostreococcus tauri TaxID=70448 RepID=A0A090M5M2_OSTTA|nr:Mitochondrial inner membrane translocase subunit Tim17/Tim22/Tim23/peroxisomal protein PMP24 [Ostreococcus tauri]OUS47990.1 Tim17/Tim22/Tim23/Pmp24 family-domain-containing protein [Ostreococcus tauri]CEF97967.1 Mitochondrial inner membrane translocase subunit Tim17/Tim22/Tim23/peroxisomal protein PMP24 [Ostreococcus tauri]|eukprot:XP_003079329.2 Mitochondrial inner membrane translocase subunit Tim17/Tim22/Tim23/peroxisomal protein PMP24 [Ostreococcus tauri]
MTNDASSAAGETLDDASDVIADARSMSTVEATAMRKDGIADAAAETSTSETNDDDATAMAKKKKPRQRKTYERVKLPTPEEVYQQDAMDNCALKTGMSFALGGALGGVMGVVFGAFEPMEIRPADAPKVTIAESVKQGARAAGARSWSYAKGFAQFGALYAGSECVVEKVRASHDMMNSAYAGCFTGGVMARTSGPQGIAMGCATMAALSVAMDKLMDH